MLSFFLVLADHLKLLVRLWFQPVAAMSAILDKGSLLFASLAALAVSLLLQISLRSLPFSFYTPLLVLAVVYVPGTVLLVNLLARLGGFWNVFQRDYSSLLTCTAMAWAAANLPLVVIARVAPLLILGAFAILAYLYFGVLMFFAVRTVFGAGNGIAAGTVCLSWIPLVVAGFAWGPLRFLFGWLASPFFLFFAYYYLGSEFSNLGAGFRSRQNFRRMLEASTVNPHDADAQYQLGLIHQHRRQYTEAIQRFQKALAIDPSLTDAHFQLGRIAREQGRLKEALAYFQTVIDQDEKHSSSETLRELAAIYLTVRQYDDARRELEIYVERRPYDPEGLYYFGQALEGLGDVEGARGMYARAVEAARTAPHYRRRYTDTWSRLAQKQSRKLRTTA